MPTIYDPTSWNSIGAKLLKQSLETLQDSNEFTFVKYKDMYTIGWSDSNTYYNHPYDQLKDVQLGYQLHMFGKMTKIINNNIPVENSLYANVIKDIGIDLCQTHPNGFIWDAFKNMISILNRLDAPYNLHGGTLLFWYRNCSLGKEDIDFTIELEWFSKNNNKLKKEIINNGWKLEKTFGTIGKAGYEEAWLLNNIKVDLFSQTLIDGKHTNGLTINGISYPCSIYKTGTITYKWSDLVIKVPVPIEKTLKSLYGDWKTPSKNYVWHIDPFKRGRGCRKNPI